MNPLPIRTANVCQLFCHTWPTQLAADERRRQDSSRAACLCRQVVAADQVRLGLRVRKDLQGPRVYKGCKDPLDHPVHKGLKVSPAHPARLVHKVHKDPRARPGHKVRKVHKAIPDRPVSQARKAHKARKATPAPAAQLAHKARLDLKGLLARLARLGLRVPQARLAHKARPDLQARKVQPDLQARKVQQARATRSLSSAVPQRLLSARSPMVRCSAAPAQRLSGVRSVYYRPNNVCSAGPRGSRA